ncbi:hypothetical protein DMN91_006916 [Ooceraea biroi]|uniref:DNA-directed RNA polymerase III subunit n=1 Tax=Ooceraea biroi TaxID=2015173 RepID=A0A3L8DKE3_OOCBI|nr:DNA-directed RNA polymerase III subunit RPC7-like [Ooceraea biroi]RLU20308.1 hypothetical protein DMN91_006916 [Ooceraea biroi]
MAGKMGGRGRGKPAMSFSMEQLGFSKGEALPAPVLQPSPSYPPLDHKPLPIELTTEMSYMVELKRDFAEYMRESPNNVQAVVLNEDIERFCEDYEESIAKSNRLEYDWSRMPVELKSLQKRKLQQQSKKRKQMDVNKKLMELEKKEKRQQTRLDEGEEEEEDAEERDTGVKEEEEADEEMDEGTDYANEYFETGESYLSEDDNDDGPTY